MSDVHAITEMAAQFHNETSPEWPWDANAFAAMAQNCIDHGLALVSDNGFFLGLIVPYPISPAWVQAHEFLMWSRDGSGASFVRKFRAWAKDQGANEIRWSCRADNERVQRFFSKIATPVEAGFSEVL